MLLCFLVFNIVNNVFMIKYRISFFLLLGLTTVVGQNSIQQKIKGSVTDTDGQPIPGVVVAIQDKKSATETNFDGEYPSVLVKTMC